MGNTGIIGRNVFYIGKSLDASTIDRWMMGIDRRPCTDVENSIVLMLSRIRSASSFDKIENSSASQSSDFGSFSSAELQSQNSAEMNFTEHSDDFEWATKKKIFHCGDRKRSVRSQFEDWVTSGHTKGTRKATYVNSPN